MFGHLLDISFSFLFIVLGGWVFLILNLRWSFILSTKLIKFTFPFNVKICPFLETFFMDRGFYWPSFADVDILHTYKHHCLAVNSTSTLLEITSKRPRKRALWDNKMQSVIFFFYYLNLSCSYGKWWRQVLTSYLREHFRNYIVGRFYSFWLWRRYPWNYWPGSRPEDKRIFFGTVVVCAWWNLLK